MVKTGKSNKKGYKKNFAFVLDGTTEKYYTEKEQNISK